MKDVINYYGKGIEREVVKLQSLSGDQRYQQCKYKTECSTDKCKYKNVNLLCSSECCGSLPSSIE